MLQCIDKVAICLGLSMSNTSYRRLIVLRRSLRQSKGLFFLYKFRPEFSDDGSKRLVFSGEYLKMSMYSGDFF
jgi:hypothetical protein